MADPDRITVLIDYQNVHGWARRLFHEYGSDRPRRSATSTAVRPMSP
ncbi:hypothetical protein [Allobranchiibius huperziae]|uniref:NYN domain-containing protein n=1 Tax=Allobranchiibius huperziae TaxID=1874116 RepID=A0A853DNS5_9MICO|nr:hypothetical protein [Allobranchiibius huperziae]NYJ75805.1 hypothetical protein [Allobranchiibius huperziae]